MNFGKQFVQEHRAALATVAAAVGGAVAWYSATKWSQSRGQAKVLLPTEWEEVGEIEELLIYPVKSTKAIQVQSAQASKTGLSRGTLVDRSFVVITESDHTFVTGRTVPQIVTMETSFEDNHLTIRALSGEEITVDIADVINENEEPFKFRIRGDTVQGIDCGNKVADWLSRRLTEEGTRVRLVYGCSKEWARSKRNFKFWEFEDLKENDTTLYMDSTSYNILCESSLRDLNARLASPVTTGYFRPSLVIKGSRAFDEDTWRYIKVGHKVVLHAAKPCERCKLTTVDPDTGLTRKDHFDELLKYRVVKHPPKLAKEWKLKPIMGLHCGIDVTGDVRVGDKVFVSRDKTPYWNV